MKDLVRGNVSSMLTGQAVQVVTDLVTGDAKTFLSPTYTVPGQYCITQPNPYPATVLASFRLTLLEMTDEREGLSTESGPDLEVISDLDFGELERHRLWLAARVSEPILVGVYDS